MCLSTENLGYKWASSYLCWKKYWTTNNCEQKCEISKKWGSQHICSSTSTWNKNTGKNVPNTKNFRWDANNALIIPIYPYCRKNFSRPITIVTINNKKLISLVIYNSATVVFPIISQSIYNSWCHHILLQSSSYPKCSPFHITNHLQLAATFNTVPIFLKNNTMSEIKEDSIDATIVSDTNSPMTITKCPLPD